MRVTHRLRHPEDAVPSSQEGDKRFTPWRALPIHALKVVVLLLSALVWFHVYGRLNDRGSTPGVAASFRPPLQRYPFLYAPWMVYIYVWGGYTMPGLPYLTNWPFKRFVKVLLTYTMGSIALFAVYALWPVIISRPAYDGGLVGESLLQHVAAFDRPANCFPSSHSFFAVSAAVMFCRSARSPWLQIPAWVLAGLIVGSTVTIGQHYMMDAAAGILLAVLSVRLSDSVLPRSWQTPGLDS